MSDVEQLNKLNSLEDRLIAVEAKIETIQQEMRWVLAMISGIVVTLVVRIVFGL